MLPTSINRLKHGASQTFSQTWGQQKTRKHLVSKHLRVCLHGRCRTRTCDIYDVNVALYQLS